MKLSTALCIPLLGVSALLERRQAFAQNGGAGLMQAALSAKPMKAYKIDRMQPKDPNAQRIKLLYGPYKLKAMGSSTQIGNGKSMDPEGTAYANLADTDFPADITVLEASSQIVDESFNRASIDTGIYNHHNVFFDFKQSVSPYACEGAQAKTLPVTVFMAGASEEGHVQFANPSKDVKTGFYLSKTRRILNMIDVVNYNKEEKTVFTESEIEYIPGKQNGYLDTVVAQIDPGTCSGQLGQGYTAPKDQKQFVVNGTGIVVTKDGYIHGLRGHMHDGGMAIQLRINDQQACVSRAKYGGDGHVGQNADGSQWESIREMTECSLPIQITKGDKIVTQAFYDLERHPARELGGMPGMSGMGMGGMRKTRLNAQDSAEQMALFETFFSSSPKA